MPSVRKVDEVNVRKVSEANFSIKREQIKIA